MAQRFAFYGRVSTEDQQDPESSRNWQLARSRSLIEPQGGTIVAEFFDIGLSRSLPWKRRAQANALLESFKDPDRGFDAVVVGEPARAFYGNQFSLTFPVLVHYGIQLWVPEVGGQVDPGSDAHDLVMALYGGMSKGERNRIKIRVRTAMATQASVQGRYLGGRPPYGYLLADAGPHPNPGKAAAGQRAHRLELDQSAASVVQRIFTLYLAGQGCTAIANQLNREGVPCPSAHDPQRNTHRSGLAWQGVTVLAILRNPRYTGHEVWNKQRKDEVLMDVEDVALGHETRMRWNAKDAWIVSSSQIHAQIIDEDSFAQAQALLEAPAKPTSRRRPNPNNRLYVLRGLFTHSSCGRLMEGSWNNGRAHYRCKLKTADAELARDGHPRTVYVREDKVLDRLDGWLDGLFSPRSRDTTVDTLHQAGEDPDKAARRRALTARLHHCDDHLAKYRTALEAGADPATVTGWISEVRGEKTRTEIEIRQLDGKRMTRQQIFELVEQMSNLSRLLTNADAADRAELYQQLGIRLSWDDAARRVLAEVKPDEAICTIRGVRGGT